MTTTAPGHGRACYPPGTMPDPLPRSLAAPRRARLALADGTVFTGFAAGARAVAAGEVVFNTGMTGYQEMLTDPSYHGQILVLTAAHVGQVGVNRHDAESDRVWARALVVQELELEPSSWRAEQGLEAWLERHGVAVGWGFDTRAIVRHVREHGAVPGVLDTEGLPEPELLERARAAPATDGRDLAAEVACREAYRWTQRPWRHPSLPAAAGGEERLAVAVVDFGVKRSILARLVAEGLVPTVLPPTVRPEEILAGAFAGVVLSNGPGDPAAVPAARHLVPALLGRLPILGICLGHQVLGLALGGRTVKLRFGHHGGNHPVRELATGRVLITAQNHNYAVEEASLPREVAITHLNLTDGTVEGLAHPGLGVEAVQFHPEAAPGPGDAAGLFARFAARCREAAG